MTDEANVLVGCGVMGPLNPGQESNPEVPPRLLNHPGEVPWGRMRWFFIEK